MTRCRVVLWTSTTGVSPLTVMVSGIEPTRKSALTVATNAPVSRFSDPQTELRQTLLLSCRTVKRRLDRSLVASLPINLASPGSM
jgi:hypothetical protein